MTVDLLKRTGGPVDSGIRNAVLLVAGVELDAARVGIGAESVEVFAGDRFVGLVVNGPEGAVVRFHHRLATRFYSQIAQGAVGLERAPGCVSVTATETGLKNGTF